MTDFQSRIFLPACGMVALTAVVWVKLYVDRIGEFNRRKLTPEMITKGTAKLENVQSSDNFKNLFEVPVLFYFLVSSLAITKSVTDLQYYGAWTYVGLRVVHSLIHCTYNKIMHRFYVYAASSVLLFGLWGAFAASLL